MAVHPIAGATDGRAIDREAHVRFELAPLHIFLLTAIELARMPNQLGTHHTRVPDEQSIGQGIGSVKF